MGKKLDEFRDRNYERHMTRKEKRKKKQEKFQKEHPKLYNFTVTVEAIGLTAILFSIPYAAGRLAKYDEVKTNAELNAYEKACNDLSKEIGRPDIDYIDDEGKYHQDLHFGAYAVWESKEAYLDAEKQRLDSLPDGYPR